MTDLTDELRELMGHTDFARYVDTIRAVRDCDAALSRHEDELEKIVVGYGLPRIPHSVHDTKPNDSAQFNNWWVKTDPAWMCPCCGRGKRDIARPDRNGRLSGALASHHDHFRDLMDNIGIRRAEAKNRPAAFWDDSSKHFLRRFTEGLERFNDIVICQDCNNADPKAKSLVGAPSGFTFTPREIAGFVMVTPNEPHRLDIERVHETYAVACAQFEARVALAGQLADIVLAGAHWFEHHDWERQPSRIDSGVEQALRMFGFRARAHWRTAEALMASKPPPARRSGTWKQQHRAPGAAPTETQLAHVLETHSTRWNNLPDQWACPGCDRTKRQIVRPTKQFDWAFLTAEVRLRDANAPYGESRRVVCGDCQQAMRDFGKDARKLVGENRAELFLDLEDLRSMVRPQPHTRHAINVDYVERRLSSFEWE